MHLATGLTDLACTAEVTFEIAPRKFQGMDLVPVLESALSTPLVVYALIAKYHVPLARLPTAYVVVPEFATSIIVERADGEVP